jgi:hypothetical protein
MSSGSYLLPVLFIFHWCGAQMAGTEQPKPFSMGDKRLAGQSETLIQSVHDGTPPGHISRVLRRDRKKNSSMICGRT